jgi:hypothetical protein
MRLKRLRPSRPSPAMFVAIVALFIALGGVGYAATVPGNSVGTNQLKHSSVTHPKLRFNSVNYQDIVPNSVGTKRANLNQLQQRVAKTCAAGTAIGTIAKNGTPTCVSPGETGTTGTATIGSSSTTATNVATLTLPTTKSYLTFANPTATVTGSGSVSLTCTLTVGSNKETRTLTVPNSGATSKAASVSLQVAGTGGPTSVSCQRSTTGTTPTISVTSDIAALQITPVTSTTTTTSTSTTS